jgi:integrase
MDLVLTDAFIRTVAAPASGRLEIRDTRCGGLVLRVTAKGVKSWSFRFRDPNTQAPQRMTLGRYPALGLSMARTAADGHRKTVAGGSNPADTERRGGDKSFGAMAARYLAEHAERKKRSHAADARNLRKHVLPKWQRRAAASIRRADAIELIEGLISDGKQTLANRVQSLVSSVFTFGMDASLVEFNPCHRLRKRGQETVGRRVLGDTEIVLFWWGVIDPPSTRRTGLGLRLALLTGARVGEVAGINRGELSDIPDPAACAWTIPGTRTKNGRDHLIPLSPLARETVLDLLGMIDAGERYLLPTRSKGRSGPMRGNTLTQAMANFSGRISGDLDAVKTWRAEPPTPHDLRRTVETRLASLRIPKEIRDRVLNHVSGDVGSKHYNLHDYADEKRAALNRWSLAVAAILDPVAAPVVDLADARRGHR